MAINVILEYGEFGYDSTTRTAKIGDGSSTWEQLDTFNKTPLVNDLVSHRTDAALTAYQGNVLNTEKINYLDIVDKLDGTTLANSPSDTSYSVKKVLSANMGTALSNKIDTVKSDIINSYKSADTALKSEIASTLSSLSTTLSGQYGNDISNLGVRVSTLEGQINGITGNATDPASTEVRAARTNSIGEIKSSLSENILNIDRRARQTVYDLETSALIIKQLLEFIEKELLEAKVGDAEAIRSLKTITNELTHTTYSELDSIHADLQSTALALNENFVDIERNLIITMYDKYILSRVVKESEQDILRHKFDSFISAQVIKKLIDEIDRNLSIEKFDVELFAHCMNVFVKSTQLFEKETKDTLESILNSTNISESDISSLKENMILNNNEITTLKSNNLTNVSEISRIDRELGKYVDGLEANYNDIINVFRLIEENDYHKLVNLEVNQLEIVNNFKKLITEIHSSISNLDNEVINNDRNVEGFNLDINSFALAMKTIINEIQHRFELINIDNKSSALSINKELFDINRELNYNRLDKYESSIALNKSLKEINKELELNRIDKMESTNSISKKLDEGYVRELDKFVNIDLQQTMNIIKYHIDQSNKQITDLSKQLEGGVSVNDSSGSNTLQIDIPRCAVVNITGTSSMPTSKVVNTNAYMEFWDMRGNYFKKKIIMAAQGSSSMGYIKKNFKFDLCNDDWIGDDTFTIKFGNWVPQDSFHCKAYYTDAFRGIGVVSYTLFNDILKSRGIEKDRPWKKALIDYDSINTTTKGYQSILSDLSLQYDTGARCVPDGFPILLYLNSNFYGVFSWQIKKDRDNYHQDKKTLTHIHLDGVLNQATIWDGTIQWNQFEIRNPKSLYTMSVIIQKN